MGEFTRREFLAYVSAVGATTVLGLPHLRSGLWPQLESALAAAPELKEVTAWGVIDAQISSQQVIADKKGFFAAQGMGIKNRLVQSGPDIGPLIAGGSAPVSFETNITVIIVQASGVPAIIVTPLANIAGTQAVVGRKGLTLRSPKDLEGMRIGMVNGAGVLIAIRNMATELGVDINKIKFINMAPADQVAAISRGDIDAMAAWEPWVTKGIGAGGTFLFSGKLSALPGKTGPVNWMDFHTTLQVTRDFLKKNPETIRRMLRALKTATTFVNSNRDETINILSPALSIPKQELREMMNRNTYSMIVDNSFVKGSETITSFLRELNNIDKSPKLKDYADFSLLEQVDPDLVKVKI
ncbi:MAG: ABC transporter substrate-binding protein [Bacillati bacterium ANGP1]|uniref:ABC transporter substrate-binding protein n=1 Tax=Candidatus Segetimicrobium genomatis TaxID=2569760 RepID=A0A537KSX6_9BACT|nr:MAG: ABC transporter substrate-binding protein [Terrabacteria group bacterium ANGP1]